MRGGAEMKKILAVLFLLVFIAACGGSAIDDSEIQGNILVTVERSVSLYGDPELIIATEKAYIEDKQLIIEGPKSIHGDIGKGWIVKDMTFKENVLIIPLTDQYTRVSITKK